MDSRDYGSISQPIFSDLGTLYLTLLDPIYPRGLLKLQDSGVLERKFHLRPKGQEVTFFVS